ncbi:MAG TPA: ATP-binding protein [Solirubrobacteraceae bacterium]|nr:ATP-binding protein [Solirubrobacteraceae bacterium]
MAATSLRLVPRRWLTLPRRSARLRLTLMYSGMFLALGTAVVVVIFLLAWNGSGVSVSASAVQAVPTPIAKPALNAAASQQHSADIARLLAVSWLTLLVTAGASAVLGWFAAGRALRPLRQMTTSARNISAGNLHERLALTGPRDEFKQLGDAFDDLLARLEGSFAAQRRFVANAAHELRTPLTLERTLLQVALADRHADAAALRRTCEELVVSGRDQEQLLDALLTLATSERGLERHEPADLARLAQPALQSVRAEIERQRLELEVDLGAAPVRGDPALLERMVANLLDNAVGYNRAGGHVGIRTTTEFGRAVLSIANTGPAIPGDQVERLFEPFQRLEPVRTRSDGHHGLGLSIVRAIASAHDATVVAEPRDGDGLVVTVRFPSEARPRVPGARE